MPETRLERTREAYRDPRQCRDCGDPLRVWDETGYWCERCHKVQPKQTPSPREETLWGV